MIGKHVLFLREVDSTNNYAAKLMEAGKLAHGTVILAERQTAGRGQRGNKWESNGGNQFIASVYLETAFLSVERLVCFNMAFTLAVRATIQAYLTDAVCIKWPNDILVANKKNAGILIETQFKAGKVNSAIAGVGINLYQENELPSSIGWSQMRATVPEPFTVLTTFTANLNSYFIQLKQGKDHQIRAEYLKYLWMLNQPITVKLTDGSELQGEIIGVNEVGDLMFQTNTAVKTFGIKEIQFQY